MTYRRTPYLVSYWQGAGCVAANYRTGIRAHVDGAIVDVLNALDDWATVDAIATRLGISGRQTRRLLHALVKVTLVERRWSHQRRVPNDEWAVWDPAAGFFHFSTRNTRFNRDLAAGERRLVEKAKQHAPPPSTLTRVARRRVPLDRPRTKSPLEAVLTRRRTWRRFGAGPLPLVGVAQLLRLAVGVQHWATTPSRTRAPLKTSPSGGMCHPIEAYVVATRVDGLAPGIYHYDAARHDLALIRPGASARTINRFVQAQPWYGKAPVLVVFTAVWGRTMWRYPHAKAYRNVLLEAGHVCQTFCLVATELGLAPFCTQAVDETAIATALRLNPSVEDVIYVAGCGKQPREGWSLGLPALDWWM